jgi:hypothetical protein
VGVLEAGSGEVGLPTDTTGGGPGGGEYDMLGDSVMCSSIRYVDVDVVHGPRVDKRG